METDIDELIKTLIAASHDERLSTGKLYREAAEAVRFLRTERDNIHVAFVEAYNDAVLTLEAMKELR